jgi:hypothetical protein
MMMVVVRGRRTCITTISIPVAAVSVAVVPQDGAKGRTEETAGDGRDRACGLEELLAVELGVALRLALGRAHERLVALAAGRQRVRGQLVTEQALHDEPRLALRALLGCVDVQELALRAGDGVPRGFGAHRVLAELAAHDTGTSGRSARLADVLHRG